MSVSFGSTYEGLKRSHECLRGQYSRCFGSTYEGLKRQFQCHDAEDAHRFGSTYEGLKLRSHPGARTRTRVLAVPMRA